MSTLQTASGIKMECDYFNPLEQTRQLNVRVLNKSLVFIAGIYSDKSETVKLFCDGLYAANFTRLVAIVPEGDAIRIVLEKE